MGKKVTSKRVASAAAKVLRNPNATKAQKAIAASALGQAEKRTSRRT